MAKYDGLDGYCNISEKNINLYTQAIDYFHNNNLSTIAKERGWTNGEMFEALIAPLKAQRGDYQRCYSFSIPKEKAKTKSGNIASPAAYTYVATMGLKTREESICKLSSIGQFIINKRLSIQSYSLILLSKVGVYSKNAPEKRESNLLTVFCKYAQKNPYAEYDQDVFESLVLSVGNIDARFDISFNALVISGLLSITETGDYMVLNKDYPIICQVADKGETISSPDNDVYSYMGDIYKGVLEIIDDDNSNAFYHKYADLIEIKGLKHSCLNSSNEDKVYNEFSNLPLQQIYYGAPGTGKSFEVDKVCQTYEHFRTTFHPDSDYSTFVGCYKPMSVKKEDVIYGVQKLREMYNEFRTKYPSHNISRFVGLHYKSFLRLTNGESFAVFKDFSAEATISSILSNALPQAETCAELTKDSDSKISYAFTPQAFTKAYIAAWKDLTTPVFLVIEEINRGNCAQIFGDLFQLLDRKENGFSTYPIKPDTDLGNYIRDEFAKEGLTSADYPTVFSGEELILPSNLHIWATMNTSDQSLFPIDSAFKRRWDWKYVPIKYDNKDWKVMLGGKEVCRWTELQQTLNDLIYDATESEDKMLGDWFVRADRNNEISEEVLVGKIIFYLWNDVAKVDAGKLFDLDIEKNGRKHKVVFSDFYKIDGNVNSEVVREWLKNIKVLKETTAEGKILNEPEQ